MSGVISAWGKIIAQDSKRVENDFLKSVVFIYIFFSGLCDKDVYLHTSVKSESRGHQWGPETLQCQSTTTGECCLATGNRKGGRAATGRKGRIREEDAWGRKNATMEHLVGLVQKRRDRAWGSSAGSWGSTEEPVTLAENTHSSDKESRVRHESLFCVFSKLPWSLALKPTRHHVGPLYRCYRGADLR